eukprot:scaffold55810_cov49-Cyclotella_meneghiniana.AAC.8
MVFNTDIDTNKLKLMNNNTTTKQQTKQYRWIPDTIPLLKSNKAKVVKSDSQANLRDIIVNCLKVGLNHFETARFYGSSECQFVDALAGLIEDGTIAREDFIFQTKLFPMEKRGDFEKQWEATW